MHYHNNEPDTMAPLVRSIIGRIVFGPAPDAPRIPLPEIEAARPEEAALPAPAEGQVSSDTEDPVLVSPLRKVCFATPRPIFTRPPYSSDMFAVSSAGKLVPRGRFPVRGYIWMIHELRG